MLNNKSHFINRPNRKSMFFKITSSCCFKNSSRSHLFSFQKITEWKIMRASVLEKQNKTLFFYCRIFLLNLNVFNSFGFVFRMQIQNLKTVKRIFWFLFCLFDVRSINTTLAVLSVPYQNFPSVIAFTSQAWSILRPRAIFPGTERMMKVINFYKINFHEWRIFWNNLRFRN